MGPPLVVLAGSRRSRRGRRRGVLSRAFGCRGGLSPNANHQTDHTRHRDSQGAADMSRYSETDTYSQATDWLMGTARRKPEALLLLAAGCCLLMRSGGNSSARAASHRYGEDASHSRYGEDSERYQSQSSRTPSDIGRASLNVREGLSRAADSATDYASQIKDRVSDTASSYAQSISESADDTRRNVSERSARLKRQAQSTLQSGMDRVLRDQPLAVAMAGLAAGAAVAAVFPSTGIEDRTFGGAREALTEAAGKAGERVVEA